MTLTEIHAEFTAGRITIEQYAALIDAQPASLKKRLSKQGSRIDFALSVLDKISTDSISRDDAAAALGINVRSVTKLMTNWGVTRPLKAYALTKATSIVKWEVRKKFSTDFIAGRVTIEQAALLSGVSDRQIRRWVSELLREHLGMVYKDLKHLDHDALQKVAKHILKAENLSEEARRTADEVSIGRKSVEEEGEKLAQELKDSKNLTFLNKKKP